MNGGTARASRLRLRCLTSLCRTFAALVLVGGTGAGVAVAAPAPVTLQYTCALPIIPDQPMTGSVVWTASDTHVVGRPTPRLPVTASARVGSLIPQTLRAIGATTISGTADVSAVVTAPQGDIEVTVPLTVPETDLPSSGDLTVRASGVIPSFVFTKAGRAKIHVGGIALHITPREADGDETFLGKVDTSCTVNSGQNTVLSSFRILPATQPGPTTSASAPGGSGGGSGGGGKGGGKGKSTGLGPSGSASGTGPGGTPTPDPSGSTTASATTSTSTSTTPAPAGGGAPTVAARSTASELHTDTANRAPVPAPVRAGIAVVAVGVAAAGCAWWLRRRPERGDA
ncbi:hypothetical protein OK074_6847 [Actinobacteria bacterium OK074]|nr:hypothetical protein OK074_6847 [Actinobacteria bacterium OK074]